MKRTPHLLIITMSILLTLACLGTSETSERPTSPTTELPVTNPTYTPTETSVPSPIPGLMVAYILDGNVWFWDGMSSARQLTNDGDAEQVKISDDGKVIVYQRGQSLWTVHADEENPHLIVNLPVYSSINPLHEGLFFTQFEFQSNTHWIYFSTSNSKGINNNDLYRVDAETPTPPQELLEKDGGTITFSPDGNLLALSSLNSINVIHADGNDLVTALHYPSISLETGTIPQVVWMENGTGFYTILPDNNGIDFKYLFVSPDGSISAQLAYLEPDIGTPIISPNGLKVAYVKKTATMHELHVVEASTTDTIIASYEGAPMLLPWNWSPDSQRVVFSNSDPILLLSAGIGIPPSPLTESITPFSLRWVSADHFIFIREGELLIGQMNNPETIIIASGFSNEVDTHHYDFSINTTP